MTLEQDSAGTRGAGYDADCIFCRIAAGELPANVVASDERFVAFNDLHPVAPVHVLIVPRAHVASLDETDGLPDDTLAAMLPFVAAVARKAGVAGSGYRVIANTGPDSGQEVMHLHWHLLGGRRLGGMA
jgi:histidine triad (HIT) family protein